jgi:hypothetical protein
VRSELTREEFESGIQRLLHISSLSVFWVGRKRVGQGPMQAEQAFESRNTARLACVRLCVCFTFSI